MCRSQRELSNAYFVAKFGFDTAVNELFQVCPLSAYRSPRWDCDLKNCTLGLDCGEVGSNGTRYSGPKACTYNTFAAADGAERDDSWLLGLVLGLGYNAVFFGLCFCLNTRTVFFGRSGGEVRGAPPQTMFFLTLERIFSNFSCFLIFF